MTALKALVDLLESVPAIHSLSVIAYGSGDEGTIEDFQLYTLEGGDLDCTSTPLDVDDITERISKVIEEKDFNYYDGQGGSLHLSIDVRTRKCTWEAFIVSEVACEDSSGEDVV